MYSSWCFLCATDKSVNVNIKDLEENLKENIGCFSLIVRNAEIN